MSIREILHEPDPRLKVIATEVQEINHDITKLLADMYETMVKNDGIGLAATQINVHKRIIVIDIGIVEALSNQPTLNKFNLDYNEEKKMGLFETEEFLSKTKKICKNKDPDSVEITTKSRPLFIINPKILSVSKETHVDQEGCLSVPNRFIEIERPSRVDLSFLDQNNNLQSLKTEGLLSRVILHELDHLNGKTILDYLSPLKFKIAMKKLVKERKFLDSYN